MALADIIKQHLAERDAEFQAAHADLQKEVAALNEQFTIEQTALAQKFVDKEKVAHERANQRQLDAIKKMDEAIDKASAAELEAVKANPLPEQAKAKAKA